MFKAVFRNTAILMIGSIIAQSIPIFVTPILSRLYSPEDFGYYAHYLSFVSIVSVIMCFRIDSVIMLPKIKMHSFILLKFSILIATLISCFFIIITLLAGYIIRIDLIFLLVVILSSWLIASHEASRSYLNKRSDYQRIAANRILQSLSAASFQVAFRSLFASSGLIAGQIVGQTLSAIHLIAASRNDYQLFNITKVEWLKAISLIKRYVNIIKFGIPALVTSRIAQESFIILIIYYYGDYTAGILLLLLRIIMLPSSILGANLGEVLYQTISEIEKKGCYLFVCRFVVLLLVTSLIIFTFAYLLLSNFLLAFLGNQWEDALLYLPFILPVSAMAFVFSPLTVLYNYFDAQKFNFLYQVLWLLSNILVFVISDYLILSVSDLLLIYSVKQVLLYLFGIIQFVVMARRNSLEKSW